MSLYDLVIIGSGPAGMTGAIYAKRANLNVLLLDRLAPGGNMVNTNEIQNYTGVGTINGAELAMNMFSHTQELGVEFDYGTVFRIEPRDGMFAVYREEEESEILTKAVLIAAGTTQRRLHVEKEEQFLGNGIGFCAICDGARYRDQDVVVIGGGNSAVEESIYLAAMVRSLKLVTMFDLTADPAACDKLRGLENVSIYPYQEILSFLGEEKLTGLRIRSTETGEEQDLGCDGVFEYIGLEPRCGFAKDLGIVNAQGYIDVNERMETKIPGIYGAGDCIVKNLRQVITACADGAIAAQEASRYIKNEVKKQEG